MGDNGPGQPGSGKSTAGPTAQTMNNPYWTAYSANIAKNWKNSPEQKYFDAYYKPPFPNAPHDGGPQDIANRDHLMQVTEKANNYAYALDNKPTWVDSLGMMVGLAPLAAVGGAVLAPAISGAVGGTAGAIAGGAGAGAITGAGGAALTGGNIGKGALMGGLMGGIGGGMKPFMNSVGLTGPAGSIASYAATREIGGALSGSINGGGGAPSRSTTGSNFLGAGAYGAGAMSGFGGQGNNGNMAGTDTSLAQTFGGAIPGLLQGAAGIYGSQNAAEKQTQADQNAIGTQTSTLGNIGNIWKTQQGLGQGADTALGSALGTNGKPADYSGFENMPGYKFATQQGTQAIQRQAASMGNAYTPNTAEAVGQYVTGTAMQDYNTYISQLMGAAGLGNSANTGIANPTMQTGENISQLQVNQGHAQASGVSGAANAVGGLFGPNGAGGSLIGAAGRYLGGGSGGGGSGGGGAGAGGKLFNGPLSNWNNTGAGNGTWGSGYDPTTGGSWVGSGATDVPSFDTSSWNDMPSMPSIDTGSMGDTFSGAGSLDYGSDMNFLGGF